jgi:hypothetical protein
MITDEIRDAARTQHAAADKEIARLQQEAANLAVEMRRQIRLRDEAQLILDGIEPCRACNRKVKSPCHDRASFHENGPWDFSCRDILYPGSVPV